MEISTVACPRNQHGAKVPPVKTTGRCNSEGVLVGAVLKYIFFVVETGTLPNHV